jgi:transcription antitermination factor NusG
MVNFASLHNRWLAVQVRAGWEMKTARSVRERGYEEFVPSCPQQHRWSDRITTRDAPIFTGYVFIRFSAENQHAIISIPGVLRFVGMGNVPVPIEDSEMQALQVAAKAAARWGPWPFLNIGQEVEIRQGPLCGLRGKLVRFDKKQRLIVTVNLLRQSAFVEIEGHDITPVGRSESVLGRACLSRYRVPDPTKSRFMDPLSVETNRLKTLITSGRK